jgi:hypothetical protein
MAKLLKSIYTGSDVTSLGEVAAGDSIDNGIAGSVTTLTSAASIAIDFSASNNFKVTLGHNATLASETNVNVGQSGSLFITQDGTGSRTLAVGSNWKFVGATAPVLSTVAASVDRLDYIIMTATAIHAVVSLDVK